mgnify:CR=1 FL=1
MNAKQFHLQIYKVEYEYDQCSFCYAVESMSMYNLQQCRGVGHAAMMPGKVNSFSRCAVTCFNLVQLHFTAKCGCVILFMYIFYFFYLLVYLFIVGFKQWLLIVKHVSAIICNNRIKTIAHEQNLSNG